jgi:hypothetical protein
MIQNIDHFDLVGADGSTDPTTAAEMPGRDILNMFNPLIHLLGIIPQISKMNSELTIKFHDFVRSTH